MKNIRMDCRVVGMIGTNSYLLINGESKECVLIDPGDSADKLSDMIDRSGCKLAAILLTHGHYDHILAADEIRSKYNVKIYASEEEKELLADVNYNLSSEYCLDTTLAADVWHKDGQELKLADIDIDVIHTPGHTKGGCCYYVKDAAMLFSGDTLFAESVGRTDFPTGSMSEIVHSVKDKLMCLPDETKVFPGHGESSSIAYEKKYNPYIA